MRDPRGEAALAAPDLSNAPLPLNRILLDKFREKLQ